MTSVRENHTKISKSPPVPTLRHCLTDKNEGLSWTYYYRRAAWKNDPKYSIIIDELNYIICANISANLNDT